VPGPAGPRVVLKDATGHIIGPAFPGAGVTFAGASMSTPKVGVYSLSAAHFMYIDVSTGHSVLYGNVSFEQPGCTGAAYVGADTGPFYVLEGGTSRLFAPSSTSAVSYYAGSTLTSGNCISGGGSGYGYPAVELNDAAYPYALPLSLAYE
jgi:hypothetical protein